MNAQSITEIELEVLDEISDERNLNWYDRVYVCYENSRLNRSNNVMPNNVGPIKGFDCYRYHSFKNANIGFDNKRDLYTLNVRHTMIPICRWVPEMVDNYILNWRLKNMYWGGQINIKKE